MPEDFPEVRAGDEVQPFYFRLIYDELRRWRKMRGDGLINVEYADGASSPPLFSYAASLPIFLRLTAGGTGSAYPWEEVHITTGRGIETTGVTGSISNDPAYELNGDTTLTADGTIYQARRSPASGELIFDGKH